MSHLSPFAVVHIAPPTDRGWWTHPTHHALEDLLDQVREVHGIAPDGFHFLGVLEGSAPATTYSRMSSKYCKSLTTLCGTSFIDQDASDLRRFRDLPVHQVSATRNDFLHAQATDAHQRLRALGVQATLHTVEGDPASLPSLRGEELLTHLERTLL